MAPAEPCTTVRAGELKASLEVQYANRGVVKVYVVNRQGQRLTNTAAEVKEKVNQKPVPKVGRRLFHH